MSAEEVSGKEGTVKDAAHVQWARLKNDKTFGKQGQAFDTFGKYIKDARPKV